MTFASGSALTLQRLAGGRHGEIRVCCCLIGLKLLLGCTVGALSQSAVQLPLFDFTAADGCRGWRATHDLAPLECTSTGLVARITGGDPYFTGPTSDYPTGTPLWMHLRLRSEEGGTGQVFFYTHSPSEANSVRFTAPAGQWHEVQLSMPAFGPGHSLRIDPPGTGGSCVLARLWFEERVLFDSPAWPRPENPLTGSDPIVMESGDLKLLHNRTLMGGFRVDVAGRTMAVGNTAAMVGYIVTNRVQWFPLNPRKASTTSTYSAAAGWQINHSCEDPDGAKWQFEQKWTQNAKEALDWQIRVAVDRDRHIVYLPLMTLLPGLGSYGTNKNQALLPGLEYLENEPSSSEADVIGPASWRLVPDSLKITFPMMIVQAEDRYVGLLWEPQPRLCAVFDSPDRQFRSGGHLLGLLFPGSDGINREERSLLPYKPETLRANEPLTARATLVAGRANTIVPAVEQYVRLKGLPSPPSPGYSADEYFNLAARGWLESRIRDTNRYRHAWWPGFTAQPAADAAVWMLWLAGRTADPKLATALLKASEQAISAVPRDSYHTAQIGHVRSPLPPTIFGAAAESSLRAKQQAQALLDQFDADGSVLYRPRPSGVDYGKTHSARDANGLTANRVMALLEAAAFSGDRTLVNEGLRLLRAVGKFRATVPRGAQTWEIPLHTPDILAAAYLLRAYTLGFELSGAPEFLEQARYWAWTGLPFVYLHPPTEREVGLYGSIAVLGATSWVAPVWFGQPVQWCGLVFADALYQFARHDPEGPWLQVADGITASGIQQTWPLTDQDRKGLLPDYFELRTQERAGPPINPATLQVSAMRFYRAAPAHEFRVLRRHGLQAHVPGALVDLVERPEGVAFVVQTWSPKPSQLLITGISEAPTVKIDGREVELSAPHSYDRTGGRLVLVLEKTSRVELTLRRGTVKASAVRVAEELR